MEARLVDALPEDMGWQFEPKWDGFRCLAYRDGGEVRLLSKAGKPLGRYFPEVVAMLGGLASDRFVLDGELIIALGATLSFGALQARLHPAESRIRRLAAETPAQLMLFDCLQIGDARLIDLPLSERRMRLEGFHAANGDRALPLSPVSHSARDGAAWLAHSGGALDGVIAKQVSAPYQPGERAMLKVKQRRSADCVVGGFRYATAGKTVGSLLLGLHDGAGLLHHVGFTSSVPAEQRAELTARLEALIEAPGFTGRAPGGASRWSTERSAEWQPLRPELVVEVLYDQVTDDRFRHGTKLLRWRPDKAPRQCGMEQLQHELRPAALAELIEASPR